MGKPRVQEVPFWDDDRMKDGEARWTDFREEFQELFGCGWMDTSKVIGGFVRKDMGL